MTDSVDKNEHSKEAIEALNNLPTIKMKDRTELSDVPRWVKTAYVFKDLLGESYRDVAARFNKSPKTMNKYAQAPAIKKWRAQVKEIADDPEAIARSIIRSQSVGVAAEYLAAFDAAIQANDYAEVGKMARDLLDRVGIQKKQDRRGPATITINLTGDALQRPIEIESEAVADYVIEDDD